MKRQAFRPDPRTEVLAFNPKAWDFFFDGGRTEDVKVADGIAVVSIDGPLEHHRSWIWDSYDEITERIAEAFEEDEVQAVVLRIDSPGGDAAGATEAHKKIRSLRKKHDKPLFAYANEQMCSAAYELGCAADEIWLPKTGEVGSVGVIATVVDRTKANTKAGVTVRLITTGQRKGDGNPNKPFTSDVEDAIRAHVDYLGQVFFKVVARSRGMTPRAVAGLEAGVFMGDTAVKAKLADGVAGWDAFLARVRDRIGGAGAEDASGENDGGGSESRFSTRKGKHMGLDEAKKAVASALTRVSSAKSDSERRKAIAAYNAAERELARLQSKARSKREEDEEDEEDEESEDEESEDEEDEEDCEDEEDEEDEEDDDSTGASSTGGSSTGSTDAVAASNDKALNAKSGLHTYHRLFRLCTQVTGERDVAAVFGALDAMGQRLKAAAKIEKRVARLETRARGREVDALLDRAATDGKITPAARASLREKGMSDPSWLKGHLKALPKTVRSEEDSFLPPHLQQHGPSQGLDMQNLTPEQRKILETQARDTGLTLEEFAKRAGTRGAATMSTPPRS